MKTFLEIKTSTPGNSKAHWRVEWAKAKSQRQAARLVVQSNKMPPFPVRVIFTRHSPRKMDRHNLPGALKHIIDGVADAYGVDDGDERWDFQFAQLQYAKAPQGVEIHIEAI